MYWEKNLRVTFLLHEFLGSLQRQVDRSAVRLWLAVRIKDPSNFIRDELDRQLGKEWATEFQKDTIVKNEHLLTSFSQRLQTIREEMPLYSSLRDALSSPK